MKSKSSFLIFVLCSIMLLPNVAGATEFKESPSDEVFSNSSKGRVVTSEEFKLISDTFVAEQEKKSSITVEDVIEQLGLKDIKVFYERDFESKRPSSSNDSSIMSSQITPNIGLENPTRTNSQFKGYPIVINLDYAAVDSYIGTVTGYSKTPGSVGGYIITYEDDFAIFNVPFGGTRAGELAVVSHYNNDARIVVEATIKDAGQFPLSRYYEVISTHDNRLTVITEKP